MIATHVKKLCSKCGKDKSILDFSLNKRQRSGLNPSCRDCENAANRLWRSTPKGLSLCKAAKSRYLATPSGAEATKKSQDRYRGSPQGKEKAENNRQRRLAVPGAKAEIRAAGRAAVHRRRTSPEGRAYALVEKAKTRAEKRGYPCDVAVDFVKKRLEQGVCEVTGESFDMRTNTGRSAYSPSLDRIDSKLGYTEGNVRVVLWAVNAACGEWGLETAVRLALRAKEFVNDRGRPADCTRA